MVSAALAVLPDAAACTGDPSVCGTVQDAKCTLREKTDALAECYNFIGPADAWDGCVQYAYVADYHWYYACANPKDASCPVYLKERHGVTETRACVVDLGVAAAGPTNPVPDHDHDGDMEVGKVCVWGFADACVLQAYECFQPYRPGFGINCI